MFTQYLLGGLTVGAIYALIAIGIVTIYNVTGIVNFAQGEFAMIGPLIVFSLLAIGIPYLWAGVIAVLATILLGMLIQKIFIYPARKSSAILLIFITMGVSVMIKAIALIGWGAFPVNVPPIYEGNVAIWGAIVDKQSLFVLTITTITMLVMYFIFKKTTFGVAIRGCMVNKVAARLMGINPDLMGLMSFGLAAGLTALGGIVIAPISLPSYSIGLFYTLKGFIVSVVGGMRNIAAVVIGGFLFGIVETFGAVIISPTWREFIGFAVLFLVLVLKPEGLTSLFETVGEEKV